MIRKLSLVELGSFFSPPKANKIYTHAHSTTSIDITVPRLLYVTVGRNGDMFLVVSPPICLLWACDIGVFTNTLTPNMKINM